MRLGGIAAPLLTLNLLLMFRSPDGQVAGLEQQRLGSHIVHVEGGQQAAKIR